MSGIFTLSISCVGGRHLAHDYSFLLEAAVESTLDELASVILRTVDFDGDHLSEFWIANGLRGKKTYITADGEWDEDDNDMWATPLSKVFPLAKNKKLYYQYDFGSSWYFQITKKGKETTPLPDLDYPRLLEEKGIKPLEYGADDD